MGVGVEMKGNDHLGPPLGVDSGTIDGETGELPQRRRHGRRMDDGAKNQMNTAAGLTGTKNAGHWQTRSRGCASIRACARVLGSALPQASYILVL